VRKGHLLKSILYLQLLLLLLLVLTACRKVVSWLVGCPSGVNRSDRRAVRGTSCPLRLFSRQNQPATDA
jgi:hypothetical protein